MFGLLELLWLNLSCLNPSCLSGVLWFWSELKSVLEFGLLNVRLCWAFSLPCRYSRSWAKFIALFWASTLHTFLMAQAFNSAFRRPLTRESLRCSSKELTGVDFNTSWAICFNAFAYSFTLSLGPCFRFTKSASCKFFSVIFAEYLLSKNSLMSW